MVATAVGIIQHTPKVHATRAGERVLNVELCVRQRAKKDGAWTYEPLWLHVVLFGTRADGLGGMLRKGSQCGATGQLHARKYTGRDGTEKTNFELIASAIWPLDWTRREEREPDAPAPPDAPDEADIPF
jgi:single-strand DNA-binding protein